MFGLLGFVPDIVCAGNIFRLDIRSFSSNIVRCLTSIFILGREYDGVAHDFIELFFLIIDIKKLKISKVYQENNRSVSRTAALVVQQTW